MAYIEVPEEIIDGYIFKIGDLKGRYRGLLQDQRRLLQEALDALDADPPYLKCVKERIETVLERISKEFKTLI